MMKCRSPRSLVFGIRNLLWFLVRSEYAISGQTHKADVSVSLSRQNPPAGLA